MNVVFRELKTYECIHVEVIKDPFHRQTMSVRVLSRKIVLFSCEWAEATGWHSLPREYPHASMLACLNPH